MCVDFVEAKAGIRSLVSLAEEMDVFGGKYLESQQHVARSSEDITSKIGKVLTQFTLCAKTISREF
jgi:hypothetical protein